MKSMIDAMKAAWKQHVESSDIKELPPEGQARRRLVYWAGWKAALQHVEAQTMDAARAAHDLNVAVSSRKRKLDEAARALADVLPEEWW